MGKPKGVDQAAAAERRSGSREETAKPVDVRDDLGRFAAGTAAGPGRPRGAASRGFSVRELQQLAVPPGGGEPYVLAMLLRDGETSLEQVRADFPPAIVRRVEMLFWLSDAAAAALLKRLRKEVL